MLLVISIIEIVGAVLGLIAGISTGLLGGAVGTAGMTGELTADEVAAGSAGLAVLSAIIIIEAVWSLLCGIFGVRAANDNQKIMIVWVFALIGVIVGVVGLVYAIVNGSFGQNAISLIVGLVLDVLLFWIANNIKREAGK
ncbi:MAG: hypothetical protein IJ111_06485 [Eggerthellaceae bacterium]|nr:hypothetical protein [Eggerthellaceae bacterium]